MKSINFKFSLLALAFILVGATTNVSAQTAGKVSTSEKEASVEIKVTGMTCAGCANNVYKVLSGIEGVIDNSVKYPGDIASVKYDSDKITPKELVATIEQETSYKAELVETKEKK